MLDSPNHRSLHEIPVVRGGGIGVAIGVLVAELWATTAGRSQLWVIALGAVVLGAVGLADDLRQGTPPVVRLGLQVIVGVIVATLLIGSSNHATLWIIGGVLLGGAWVVGFVNCFNFMDGVNGISGVSSIVTGCVFLVLGALHHLDLLTIGGSALICGDAGFLPWNFPKAKIFLGDVGSYFIGATIAGFGIYAATRGVPPIQVLAPSMLYLTDVAFTLVVRYRRHERLTEAHRDHVFQRLVASGWTHVQVVAVVAGFAGLQSAAVLEWYHGWVLIVGVLIAGVISCTYLALPAMVLRRQRRH